MSQPQSRWELWNVDETTKRRIKAYAALNGIDLAEALKRLVDIALAADPAK
jgi:hypothetical protein